MRKKCFTCQGDKKIMASTGDRYHPLQAIPCPTCQGKSAKRRKKKK
jgi:hypothetical protein